MILGDLFRSTPAECECFGAAEVKVGSDIGASELSSWQNCWSMRKCGHDQQ